MSNLARAWAEGLRRGLGRDATGLTYEVGNGVEDITQPDDVWRKHRLTGAAWLRLYLAESAGEPEREAFRRIQDFIGDQIVALQKESKP